MVRRYLRMERNSRALVKLLKADGWTLVSVRGSHHKFRKGERTVIIPHPKRDLPTGTGRAIYRHLGWSER